MKIEGGHMTDTEDYIVFDRTGTPHVVVAVKTEIGGNCQQSENREGDMEPLEYTTHCDYCGGIARHLPGCPDERIEWGYEDDRDDYLED